MYKGTLLTGDFQENTMTFEIDGDFELSAGEYSILSKKEHSDLKNQTKQIIEWKYSPKETPHVYESGDWDGKRSDEVIAEDVNGKKYIARLYSGTLDGSEFNDWVDSSDFIINDEIKRWVDISHL